MINHIQTLLLNESASAVTSELDIKNYGYIDSKFASIPLTPSLRLLYDVIIPEKSIQTKLNRVKQLLVYTESPEFSKFLPLFDTRVTYSRDYTQDITNFYNNIPTSTELDMHNCILAGSTSPVFNISDTNRLYPTLRELHELFLKSPETVKRFSALLFAMIIQLHTNYTKVR